MSQIANLQQFSVIVIAILEIDFLDIISCREMMFDAEDWSFVNSDPR